MTAPTLYQDFGAGDPVSQTAPSAHTDAQEDEMLEAFENGYQAGWDDSAKAQSSLDLSVSSAMAANLQDASLKYHEMRDQLTGTVQQIIQGVVDSVLPDMARLSLGAHIVQLVEKHARSSLDRRIELRVPGAFVDQVERLMPETNVDYKIVADPSLGSDQASLQFGETEHTLDLGQVVQEVATAVTEYFETQTTEGKDDRSA